MMLVGTTKYTVYSKSVNSKDQQRSEESDNGNLTEIHEDSGSEDEESDAYEEMILPEYEEDEDELSANAMLLLGEDEELFQRQLSYPPLPTYMAPFPAEQEGKEIPYDQGDHEGHAHPRERVGALNPLEEVTETEPPSTAETEASSYPLSNRKKRKDASREPLMTKTEEEIEESTSASEYKSILKKTPLSSPERKVKFAQNDSETSCSTPNNPPQSRKHRHISQPTSSDNVKEEDDNTQGTDADADATQPKIEQKSADLDLDFQTWTLASDSESGEFPQNGVDGEFASILDDIIADLHSWNYEVGSSVTEVNASRQQHFANVSSQLSSYLEQITGSTLMSNLAQLIPLLTTMVNVTELNFRAQLSSLSTVSVFAHKLRECKSQSGLKVLPNGDLTWLIRSLCDISSESSGSVVKSAGTSVLASLVKAAGPEMILEPILFILTGKDEKVPKRREGSGKIVYTGIPGGTPKMKATALDVLTFALLTFPRDNFNLSGVGKVACCSLLHPKRRVRQAALECIATIAHCIGPTALPMFKKFVSDEQAPQIEQNTTTNVITEGRSTSLVHHRAESPIKEAGFLHCDPELEIDPRILGPPSRIPVPIKASTESPMQIVPQQKLNSSPKSKRMGGGPSPGSALAARLSRRVLPSPSLEELVEYGVKIPANCNLLNRQAIKVETQDDTRDEIGSGAGLNERLSSSGSSGSNIEYSLLELDPLLVSHGGSGRMRGKGTGDGTLGADVEWILNGSGPVRTCDSAFMFPKERMERESTNFPQRDTSKGSDSDFSSMSENRGGSSEFNMRRNHVRGELLQDAYPSEPMLGRNYFSPNNQLVSPRVGINSSNVSSSRYAPKSSYNLLPNKYSLVRGGENQFREARANNYIATHLIIPGSYESPFFTNPWQTELGALQNQSQSQTLNKIKKETKIENRKDALEDLRENFFAAQNNEIDEDYGRPDSQQSEGSGESDPEKTDVKEQGRGSSLNFNRSQNNQNARKPPIPSKREVITNDNNESVLGRRNSLHQDEISVRRQSSMMGPREYQVYHSRVQIVPSGIPSEAVVGKRCEVDSAGSNHTRDSGVSMGSVGGSKTPPSLQSTPPSQHKSPMATRRNGANDDSRFTKADQRPLENKNYLHKSWQSSPDVPLDVSSEFEERMQQREGHPCSGSRNTHQAVKVSASEENMQVHHRPVLARRGQSVTRVPGSINDPAILSPPYSVRSTGSNKTRNHLDEYDNGPDRGMYTYRVERPSLSSIRNSLSTGNLVHQDESDQDPEAAAMRTPRTGRVSSRREGPFGDVRAIIDDEMSHQSIRASTLPTRKNVGAKVNGKIVPTKIYKGSFREINGRKGSNGSTTRNEIFPADMKPVTSPKHALPLALGKLESADWETNVDGFRQIVRLVRFDSDTIRGDLRTINMAGVKHLTNLRSQVCRAAILCFQELFTHLGRSMEPDCEKIAEKLLDKAADTNKFIREDSGKALEAMMTNLTSIKGLTCLDLFGTRHRNPIVRCMAAKLMVKMIDTIGPDRCLNELPERLLPMLCKLLQEGSLETRTSAKSAMSSLMVHPSFNTLLRRYVPPDVLRHIQKSIDALQK